MSENWSVVFDAESGECVSIGTEVADPLPMALRAVVISDAEADALNHCRARWDAVARAVVFVDGQ